jgi:hypothetical protein
MNSIHHLQVIFSFSFQIPVYFAFDILIPDSFATVMVFFFLSFPFSLLLPYLSFFVYERLEPRPQGNPGMTCIVKLMGLLHMMFS